MKIMSLKLIEVTFLIITLSACATPTTKVYKSSDVLCTWETAPELIICIGRPTK